MATPALAPHRPIETALSLRSVNTLAMWTSVAGKIIAAPIPITDRAAMSAAGEVVKAPQTLANPKTAKPPATSLYDQSVRETPRGQQQRGKHQVVGINNPLKLGRGGVELAHQRGQSHVHDRRVQVDGKRGQKEGPRARVLNAHAVCARLT